MLASSYFFVALMAISVPSTCANEELIKGTYVERVKQFLDANEKSYDEHGVNIITSDGTMVEIEGIDEEWILKNKPRSGVDELTVRAQRLGGRGYMRKGFKPSLKRRPQRRSNRVRRVSGSRKMLAVRIIGDDAATTSSEAVIGDKWYGTNGDTVNFKSQTEDCSYNAVTVTPATSTDNAGITTLGVVTVTVAMTITGADDNAVLNAANNALEPTLGSHPLNFGVDHVMFCIPPGTQGGWIAYAGVNSWFSAYNDDWCNYVSGQMHEIGHNWGLAHSWEGSTEYADQTGMMGYSYFSDNTPLMCFNGPKSWQLGWYSDDHVSISGTYVNTQLTLAGVDHYNDVSTTKSIVEIDAGTTDNYYVSYNKKTGINSGTVEAGNQVVVHTYAGSGYSKSTIVAKLVVGGTYDIRNFGGVSGNTLTITFVGTNGNYADISIVTPSPSPTTSSPTPSPTTSSPTNEPTPAPTTCTPYVQVDAVNEAASFMARMESLCPDLDTVDPVWGPDARLCTPTQRKKFTTRMHNSMATGFFGGKDLQQGGERDCNAYCLYDIYKPNRHYRWNPNKNCWTFHKYRTCKDATQSEVSYADALREDLCEV